MIKEALQLYWKIRKIIMCKYFVIHYMKVYKKMINIYMKLTKFAIIFNIPKF